MNIAALTAALRGDLGNALIASMPGGIERQEATGQQALLELNMLPKEVRGATREQLSAIGFKFGAPLDELFVYCELPSGWTKRGSDNSLHSDLLDEQGRKRASIFYKAAFYDRRADMRMETRFQVECYGTGSSDAVRRVDVSDSGKIIKEFGEVDWTDWTGMEKAEGDASAWLDDRYPDWRNPMAYW